MEATSEMSESCPPFKGGSPRESLIFVWFLPTRVCLRVSKHKAHWKGMELGSGAEQFPEATAFLLPSHLGELSRDHPFAFRFYHSPALFFGSSRTFLPCSAAWPQYLFSCLIFFSSQELGSFSHLGFCPSEAFQLLRLLEAFWLQCLGDHLMLLDGGFAHLFF